jgi:hypothetical protein
MTETNEPITWQDELNNRRLCEGGWYGCVAPDGWKDIVLKADAMLAYMDPKYKITQIKEKWGTLRYYFETEKSGIELDIMYAIATQAEAYSASVCETCGKFGELRTERRYIQTLCSKCEDAVAKEVAERRAKL